MRLEMGVPSFFEKAGFWGLQLVDLRDLRTVKQCRAGKGRTIISSVGEIDFRLTACAVNHGEKSELDHLRRSRLSASRYES